MKVKSILEKDFKVNTKTSRKYLYIWRYGNYYQSNKENKIILKLLRIINRIWYVDVHGIDICFDAEIGEKIKLPHLNGIVIAGKAKIGSNCTIFQQVTIGIKGTDENNLAAEIGNNVLIGAGAKIIGNIKIGNNVKIGANAVVTKDIPDNCTVVQYNKIVNEGKKRNVNQ